MKKSILILTLIAAVMLSVLAVPAFADVNQQVTIAYGTPVVDGQIDDVWANTPTYKTPYVHGGGEAKSNTLGEWRFLWDENRIYVLCDIYDEQLNHGNAGTYWQGDCTQLFFDMFNTEDFANCSYGEFGAQLGIRYAWEGGVFAAEDNFVVESLGAGFFFQEGDPEWDDCVFTQVDTDKGWRVEYSFNPTLFYPDFKLEAGTKGGIDFVNDDSNEGSTVRDTLYLFMPDSNGWSNPKTNATFTLAGKDEVVDIAAIEAERKAAEEAAAAEAAARQALIDGQIADGVQVVKGTAKIDGEIDAAWANVPAYKAEYIYQNGAVKSVCEPTMKFMWDDNKMYALLEVKDEQLNALTNTLWANDNLQFFIDFGHGHDFAANNYDGDNSALAIRYCWLGGVVELPAGFTVTALGGAAVAEDLYNGIEKAQKTVDGGWVCEFALDPSILATDLKRVEGAQGGLDYVVDDTNTGNDTGSRDTLYVFSILSDTWSKSTNLIPFTFVNEAKAAEEPKEEVVETPVEEPKEEVVETPVEEPKEEVVETPAVEEPKEEVVETPKAPQTFDFAVIAAIAAVISCAGYAISKKH